MSICSDPDLHTLERYIQSVYEKEPTVPLPTDKHAYDESQVKQSIQELFAKYDGLVLGGNDFLYTKDMDSHPCSYFLYEFGPTLVENGLDTIFLENHYLTEPVQTRGLIGHVMYCAYLFNLRVIGIEGKFTPEQYLELVGKQIEAPWTTVAFQTKKRIDRLNIITKDIVDHYKKGKYLLFCGMSHVNDETKVTQCKGIKTLLEVPGCGASFADQYAIIKDKPFVDNRSGYRRDADYMIEVYQDKKIDQSLYVNAMIYCMVHDYLFFYKTYRNVKRHQKPPMPYSVKKLWNHQTTIYPHVYRLYAEDVILRDERLAIPSSEIDDLCSYVHSVIKECKAFPSRMDIVNATAPLTEEQLYEVVDKWVAWMKDQTGLSTLTRYELDACSDIIFLEYKKLSLDDDEVSYIAYIKNKFIKQLERPEHKLFTLFRLMDSLHITISTNKLLERAIAQFRIAC